MPAAEQNHESGRQGVFKVKAWLEATTHLVMNWNVYTGLLDAGIQHDYSEATGGHDWRYWTDELADGLRFLDRHVLDRNVLDSNVLDRHE